MTNNFSLKSLKKGKHELDKLPIFNGIFDNDANLPDDIDVISNVHSDILFDRSDRYEMAVISNKGVVTFLILNNKGSYEVYVKIKRILEDHGISIDSIYYTTPNVLDYVYKGVYVTQDIPSKSDNLTRFETIIDAAIEEQAANISILYMPGDYARISFEIYKQNIQYKTLDAENFIELIRSYYNDIKDSDKTPANFSATSFSDTSSTHTYTKNDASQIYRLRYHQSPAHKGGFEVTIRLNQIDRNIQSLPNLGYDKKALDFFDEISRYDEGIVLWSGSTSSGKTTSNASLSKLISDNSKQTKKIITYEDPVEITVPGSYPSSVFSNKEKSEDAMWKQLMESAMRRAPHVVYVGEIRMSYVAQSCIRLALSGHLTLSTIHAYDPFQAINLLASQYDVNLSTLLMPRVLRAIVAQKLVPILCPDCSLSVKEAKETILPHHIDLLEENFGDDAYSLRVQMQKDSCKTCQGRGRIGLQPIYEIYKPCGDTVALLLQERYIEAKAKWASKTDTDGYSGVTFHKRAKNLVLQDKLCAIFAIDKVLSE